MILSIEEIEKRVNDSYELENSVLKSSPNPLVTVRTSTYQHGSYIKQCIEGVLMQKTDFDFEFIIGEDFSTDETREIVFEYAKKYPDIIRVFTADYNVGSKANGTRCIRAARGKYMALCEGDDYWIDPLKLQRQVDFIESNKNCTLVFHLANRINSDNKILGIHGPKIEESKCFFSIDDAIYKSSTLVPTNSMLFKTTYAKNLPEWILKAPVGDIPLTLLLAHNGRLGFINKVMSVYRVMTASSWSKRMQSNKKKRVKLFRRSKLMWQNFDEWSEFKYTKIIAKNNKKNKLLFMINELKIRFPFFYSILKKPFLFYKKRL